MARRWPPAARAGAALLAALAVGAAGNQERRLQYAARHADILVRNLDFDKLSYNDRAVLESGVASLVARACGIGQPEVGDINGGVGKVSVVEGTSIFPWSTASWPPVTSTVSHSTAFSCVVTIPVSTAFLAEQALQEPGFSHALMEFVDEKLGPVPALVGEMKILKASVVPVSETPAPTAAKGQSDAATQLASGEELAFGKGVQTPPPVPSALPVRADIPLPPEAHEALAELEASERAERADTAPVPGPPVWALCLIGISLSGAVLYAAVSGLYHVLGHAERARRYDNGSWETLQRASLPTPRLSERDEERGLLYDRLASVFSTRPPVSQLR